MGEISKLAEKIFVYSFLLELNQVKCMQQDQKESTEEEFRRYKEEVESFYCKIKGQREEIKGDDEEISRLIAKAEKQMLGWEEKYNLVAQASKMAFQRTEQLLNFLIPRKQFLKLYQERDNIQKKIRQCKGTIKKIATETSQLLDKYQEIKQLILPRLDIVKYDVFREITTNFSKEFGAVLDFKQELDQEEKKNIQQIEKKQDELLKFFNCVTDTTNEQIKFEFKWKLGQNKNQFQKDFKRLEIQNRLMKKFKLLKINKKTFRNLIADIITVNEAFSAQVMENSKFLIQPIYGSDKYLKVDVTDPVLDKTQCTAPFKFYYGMGFIHLSQSLVVAGGLNIPNTINTVHQLFENHKAKSLPPMKLKRSHFPLVEFNDGETIIAICGFNGSDNHSECQKWSKFKNWSDLPSTSQKFKGASACSVGESRVFVFGGVPINRAVSAQTLDLNRVDKKWEKIDVPSNLFKESAYDSAVYLEGKMIVFGSWGDDLTVQMNVLDDMGIEIEKSQELPFEHRQSHLVVWKRYEGSVYSMSNERDKVWRYYEGEWI